MKTEDQIPRRNRLDLCTPAEVAVYGAMQEVEKMGADLKLTEAVTLLAKAKDLIADFIDGGLTKSQIKIGGIYLHSNGKKVRVIDINDGYIPIECEFIDSGSCFSCVPGYLLYETI